eukprot:5148751-Prymnesium_polylepis.1
MLNLPDRSDDLLLRYSFSLPRVSRIRSAAVLLTAPIDSARIMRLTTRCSGSASNAVASALYKLHSSRSCGVCDREVVGRFRTLGRRGEGSECRRTHRLEECVEGAATPLGVRLVLFVNHRNRQPCIECGAHFGRQCLAGAFEERALVE